MFYLLPVYYNTYCLATVYQVFQFGPQNLLGTPVTQILKSTLQTATKH